MSQNALATTANNKLSSTPTNDEWNIMLSQAKMLVSTNFLPQSIKTPEQAIAIMLQGRELGIPTMAALGTINVIQGKPTVSPQLMLALINRSGQCENVEITNDTHGATCTMKRRGRTAHTEFFGEKEAAAMGLNSKDNYKKQAATMYRWRAVAACARVVFPDVVLGLYTPDEMGAEVNSDGELLPEPGTLHQMPTKTQLIEDAKPAPAQNEPEPINKQITDHCSKLNDAKDSIVWNKGRLTEYVNELFDTDVKSFIELDEDKKQVLLGDLEGRLAEIEAIKNENVIEAEFTDSPKDDEAPF